MEARELAGAASLHHAYIVSGSAEGGVSQVVSMLEKRGVAVKGNPDILQRSFSELGVADARAVASFASLKPFGDAKYILLSFGRATSEAQNALLKIVEESPGNSIFFFSVDAAGHLLPTLRSRCVVVHAGTAAKKENEDAKEFLTETYAERLSRIEAMARDATRTQDRSPVREFVRALIALVHREKSAARALRDLSDADRYLRLSGASVKAILGHLAVSLPRSKRKSA